jgi:WD40 repeat protein
VESSTKGAHENQVRCLDIDPFPTYHLCSGGDDGKIKIWDVRKGSAPLKVLHSHSHWITSLKYNPVHDELILSSSSDALVDLWYVPTICFKESQKDMESEETQKEFQQRKDAMIQSFDDHEESVYSVAWSNSASWVFASVSFDGRVLIHTVPSKVVSEINI